MRRLATIAFILPASGVGAEIPLSHVERTYWDCESAALQALLAPDDAQVCSETFEYLKQHKFQGDFDRFLVWWQDNHRRELATRRAARPPVPE